MADLVRSRCIASSARHIGAELTWTPVLNNAPQAPEVRAALRCIGGLACSPGAQTRMRGERSTRTQERLTRFNTFIRTIRYGQTKDNGIMRLPLHRTCHLYTPLQRHTRQKSCSEKSVGLDAALTDFPRTFRTRRSVVPACARSNTIKPTLCLRNAVLAWCAVSFGHAMSLTRITLYM